MKFLWQDKTSAASAAPRFLPGARRWADLGLVLLRVILALIAMSGYVQAAEPSGSKRFALVIGNDQYLHVGKLQKAANDAQAMGKALQAAGFSTRVLVNASRSQMNRAVNQFATELEDGGVGVFFFAGHGVQINNQNFLIPVDLQDYQVEGDIADQSVSLQSVQDKLVEARAKFTLLVVDACRDNPFPRKSGRALGATRGLSQASSAEGQIVVFSAGANQQALDKLAENDENPNGLFTREFLPWVAKPGVTVRDAVLGVRSAVRASARSVNHEQFPAVYDQAEGDFYFHPAVPLNEAKPAAITPAISDRLEQLRLELAAWEDVKATRSAKDLSGFLERHPGGQFADIASARLEGLKAAEAEQMAYQLARTEKLANERLSRAPSAAVFASEDKDWNVAPRSNPRTDAYHAHTPMTVPGAKVIRTVELTALLEVDKTAVVIDVLDVAKRDTIPDALWMPGLGNGFGKDLVHRALDRVTGGRKDRPLVFMCVNSMCWLSYNAALHAVSAGFTQVYWYRGGSAAWATANLPVGPATKLNWKQDPTAAKTETSRIVSEGR